MRRTSKVNISVTLDDQNVPELITWQAEEGKDIAPKVVEAINLSFWNGESRETMKMDLWTKKMPVHEMKMFYVDMVGSLSDSIINSTGDAAMSKELKECAEKLMKIVESEFK